MNQSFLLIDFENVRDVALGSFLTDWRILIFVGKSQHSIPFEVTRDAQQLGSRLEWIKIEGDGRNNLGFHIAFHLGQLSAKHPEAAFLILSKDKGFEPLIKHAVGSGLKCKRIETLDACRKMSVPIADPNFERAFKLLSGIAKNSRPRKQKTLTTQVASFFQKKERVEEIERIVDQFFTGKLVSETNGTLTYNF